LGVDLGSKRIGLAISSPEGGFAHPLSVIDRKGGKQDLQEVAQIAADYGAEAIVVGLPVNLRGQEAEAATHVMAEVETLRKLTPLPVETLDERMTTAAAQKVLLGDGVKRAGRKQVVDKVAATLLLQTYLDIKRREDGAEETETR
jgi:putative holliday junction resolvase